ncbi:MAG: hypothetical protein H6930_10375 [Rhodoferax sp.]|jgi:hypothetical protein|nr:hypothetical protein [Rhodoferax sp.]
MNLPLRRRFVLLAATAAAATSACTDAAWAGREQPRPASDRMVLPPDSRTMRSPSGRYQLVIRSDDHWKTRLATGELTDLCIPGHPVVWQMALPQTQGPRRALVTDQGATVMLDSWLNVASPHAIVVVDPLGRMLAVHEFDAIVAVLGVSRRTVAQHARLGPWLSGEPVVSDDGTAVMLEAGGRHLQLTLADGKLAASR